MKLFVIDRKGEEHTVEATVGDSLMLSLRANDLVDATCSGSCSCATCHLFIGDQWVSGLPTPSEDEAEVIEFLKFAQDDSRLSCQLVVTEAMDGMKVTVAPEEGFLRSGQFCGLWSEFLLGLRAPLYSADAGSGLGALSEGNCASQRDVMQDVRISRGPVNRL